MILFGISLNNGDESMDTDIALVMGIKAGRKSSFGKLVERHKKLAYSMALGLVGNKDDAYDISGHGNHGDVDFDDDDMPIIRTAEGRHITPSLSTWVVEEAGSVKAQISQIPIRLPERLLLFV